MFSNYVPSSGACGWNTTHSQRVPAGNFLSNFFSPICFTKDPSHPHFTGDPWCDISELLLLIQATGKEAFRLWIPLGVRQCGGLQGICSDEFFFFQFLSPQAPSSIICPLCFILAFLCLSSWLSISLAGSDWILELCEGKEFLSLWIPSLWRIVPSLYKCSCWMHDT